MPEGNVFIPGTQVMLEVKRLTEGKVTTFFRGCKEDHYIILDYPYYENGVPFPVKDGMSCIVRFLYQGKAYAFESKIMRTSKYPYPFLFIRYPEDVDNINLRNSERYPIRIPVFFNRQALEGDLKNYSSGTLLDLSEKGCLLEGNESVEQEKILFLAFNLPNQEGIKNLAAKVKRISRRDEFYRLGMMFMVSEDPDIEKIKEYLSYLAALQIQA